MKNPLGLFAGAIFFLVVCMAVNSCERKTKVYRITAPDTIIVVVCPHSPPCQPRCR